MCLSYIVSIIAIAILVYVIFMNYYNKEDFYPYRGWGNRGWGGRWGWDKSYLYDTGNWRPYQYYPAYSGYWRECPNGDWVPPYSPC